MIKFINARDIIQKRYKLNIAQASKAAKQILKDKYFTCELALKEYLSDLENSGGGV